jgi:glutaminase
MKEIREPDAGSPSSDDDRAGKFERHLDEIHRQYVSLRDGVPAGYIPELAAADPNWLGIAVVTAAGQVAQVGDADRQFTIQSISKPFVYGLALEELGRDAVLAQVGVEPSGDPFNSITFDERHHRPHNPLVNAGAIATTALIGGAGPSEKARRLMAMFRRYAGRDLAVDVTVFNSERETGDRNRAIAYLMKSLQMIDADVFNALDLYFEQCSLLVTCRDLATMAATLANDGVNPLTGERALADEFVSDVLSVMFSCGLYDASGTWAFDVGLPAKSGVGGGMLAVVPGLAGIGVFSPPLDENGNSVRGIAVCRHLAREFGLHAFATQRQRARFQTALAGDRTSAVTVAATSGEDA